MSDREIRTWPVRLMDHVERKYENYKRQRISLATARDLEPFHIAGEFIYIEEVSSDSANAEIRLDRNTNNPLDLVKGTELQSVFEKFFLTNIAQAGEWLDLIVGINFEYRKPYLTGADLAAAQSVVPLTHANPDTDVSPAAQISNRALIKADVNNTQTAWIDFRTAAVQNACYPLDPGEPVFVTIENLNLIHANFEVGGEYVFIVYEV